VTPQVFRVLAPNPGPFTLEGTNTWVVGWNPSAVIDPGPEDPEHVRLVARAAGRVAAILVTHGHPDHAPGAELLAELVDAPVLAAAPRPGQERLRDDHAVGVGGAELRSVRTPGHATDHIAFYEGSSGALFTGDAVLGRGTTVINPPDGDLAAYLRSLDRMRELSPRTIYPGHGPTVFDGPGKLREYAEHRAMREQQVLDAIRDGHATIGEMVPVIYAEYPPELHELAGRQVMAQLVKLEREGRVARRGRDDKAKYELIEPKACERCGRPAMPRSRFCGRCSMAVLQEGPSPQG
jgi:glyoxylase-like metal-dependent hydrolase (beta-lactamase superfamily II)